MIRVTFKIPDGEQAWWDAWQVKANKARDEVIAAKAAGEDVKFNSEIWGDLKRWLLKHLFYGKCAYCETKITVGFVGDAEHYRPKGAVRIENKDVVVAGKAHPGYYWLAYDPQNLFPACELCNQAFKRNEFPLLPAEDERGRGHRVDPNLDSTRLNDEEKPCLLHPYNDEPTDYLRFGDAGVVVAVDAPPDHSRRGKETIRICGLMREDLADERRNRQVDAAREYSQAPKGTENAVLAQFRTRPYYAAVKSFIRLEIQRKLLALEEG